MSVTNAETFKLSGGACKTTDGNLAVIDALAQAGLTGTNSSGVITVDKAGLDGAEGVTLFGSLLRIAEAANAKLTYTVAS